MPLSPRSADTAFARQIAEQVGVGALQPLPFLARRLGAAHRAELDLDRSRRRLGRQGRLLPAAGRRRGPASARRRCGAAVCGAPPRAVRRRRLPFPRGLPRAEASGSAAAAAGLTGASAPGGGSGCSGGGSSCSTGDSAAFRCRSAVLVRHRHAAGLLGLDLGRTLVGADQRHRCRALRRAAGMPRPLHVGEPQSAGEQPP